MGEKTTRRSICMLMMSLIIFASLGQGIANVRNSSTPLLLPLSAGNRGGSIETWKDDFLTTEKIDQTLSQNILIDTTAGTVSMQGTYTAWTDPSFSRMRPIVITNSGTETLSDYNVNMTVAYDADMQPDFDDLRFKNQVGNTLPYFILKKVDGITAEILVTIPVLPPGQTTIFMFYANPSASSQSNFDDIFTWRQRTKPDTMISFKAAAEGAWDPHVEYGAERFLVTWEERLGPEDIHVPLPHYHRTIPGVIHGRTYNIDGEDPVPQNNSDIQISDPMTVYHAENPCSAFGGGNFFVVWEQNPANQPLQRFESDIKGALVTPAGQVTMRFNVCSATGGQFDPQVAFDSYSNRFMVVWADARNGWFDYDVRGRLYNIYGFPIGADFPVAFDVAYQGNPWIASDNQGNFLIVYEDGPDPELGPFSLYAYRYDFNGNRIGSRITIAVGSATQDHIFPGVSYNPKTERFFVTWNDADISVDPSIRDSYSGNIWGKILTRTGSVVKNNFIVEAGTSFIRSESVPFFDTMFFVAYDGIIAGNQDMYGRVVSAEGTLMTARQELSDGSSLNVDWNSLAVGQGRVFACWEDERDQLSAYADVFGYVWRPVQSIGSPLVSYSVGQEVELITQAQVMSVPIQPEELHHWLAFQYVAGVPSGCSLVFDLMDENGTVALKQNMQNDENLSDVNVSVVRLKGSFTRVSAEVTPVLFNWSVSAVVGKDIYPPATFIHVDPAQPNGQGNWYVTPVMVTFTVIDVDSDPENITTYYDINGGGAQVYDPDNPPVISSNRPNNSIEFWSNDSINEELPHQWLHGIHIDMVLPMLSLHSPPYIILPGTTKINGSASDYASGSGIDTVRINVNNEVSTIDFNGEASVWFERSFTADRGETYDILVEVWDVAGNKIEERRTVLCPDYGVYDPGYIYLFNNPKIGPVSILVTLGLSIAVNYDSLFVVLPGVSSEAASVKFIAKQVFLEKEHAFWDMNLSDGCAIELIVPFGFYEIKAFAYDSDDTLLEEYSIITKMMILLL